MLSKSNLSVNEKPTQYRTLFTEEEDNLLRKLVEQYGENQWEYLSRQIGTRSSRQCRERWTNYLSPRLSQGPWSKDEDRLLFHKVKKYGKKWELLVRFFPTRSRNNIKNRYNTIVRKGLGLGLEVTTIEGFILSAERVESRNRPATSSKKDLNVNVPQINPIEKYSIQNFLI
ncbi:Myb-like DNA-binding domain containing protein [Trichomonas vaginalis G3]|uniref:Myb-like DNA-binding domain containing protein n=1 Tax=Trichomonas vaginalis (strain ATCC PRA-98 / G3) TaxID=412133 RepID=A2DCQ9_TRIV3|nr:RNA polymerase II transcription regulator recruiting protein [Trichomonas vaginalis G3]EAY21683.1 Myb-like DNA-binding domain containing protein [Trichomonas vaginalis G3]KAI5524337.1 RNA polymerase II transcription regulator recruiting protein [Trichomonas vaginalis G3]|eukprot:XP_001582669.1 Myb-like DNA-binding domain containing protein [Trichomonas vaginalis G3]